MHSSPIPEQGTEVMGILNKELSHFPMSGFSILTNELNMSKNICVTKNNLKKINNFRESQKRPLSCQI